MFILSFVFLFLGTGFKNADTYSADSSIQTTKVAGYYKKVFQAEDSIVSGNYIYAGKLYQEAFILKKPFCIDLSNALMVELLGKKDSAKVVSYLSSILTIHEETLNELLAEKESRSGYGLSPSQRSKLLRQLPYWNNIVPILRKPLFLSDKKNKIKLEKLLKSDQDIRHSACTKLYSDFYANSKCRKEIMYVDSINQKEVIKIIQTGTIDQFSVGKSGMSAIYIIALHNGAWLRNNIHNLLHTMVLSGSFDAREYAELMDRYYGEHRDYENPSNSAKKIHLPGYGTQESNIVNDILFIYLFDENKRNEIDNRRDSIFLESYKNRCMKLIWQFNQSYFHFLRYDILVADGEEYINKRIAECQNPSSNCIMTQRNVINPK